MVQKTNGISLSRLRNGAHFDGLSAITYSMKTLLILLGAIFASVAVDAQNDMSVSIPNYKEFALINADGVNLRKAPNVSSPKMMVWNSDGGSYDTVTEYYFMGENPARHRANSRTGAWVEAVHPDKGDVLPVIGESGDWYKVVVPLEASVGNSPKPKAAYIMKRFATKHTAASLDAPFVFVYEGREKRLVPLSYRNNGAYTKVPFAVTESDYSGVRMEFPVMAGDCFVCSQEVNLKVEASSDGRCRLTFTKEQDEDVMTGEIATWTQANLHMPRVSENDMESGVTAALKKLTDSDFCKLVNFACEKVGGISGKLDNGVIFQLDNRSTPYMSNTIYKANANRAEKVYETVNGTKPSFPGGASALQQYLAKNLRYPVKAVESKTEGKVLVRFVVMKDGSVSNVSVARSVDPSLDKEAVRVIQGMPKWSPGTHNGKAVNVRYTCPITFKL